MTHVSSPSLLSPFHHVLLPAQTHPVPLCPYPAFPCHSSFGSHVPKVVLQAKPTILA